MLQLQLFIYILCTLMMSAQTAKSASTDYGDAKSDTKNPVIGMIVFPGFEVLDCFGPLEFFNMASISVNLTVITIGPTTGPINSQYPMSTGFDGTDKKVDYSRQASQTIISQYSFETAPHVDILFVPGGLGIRGQEDAGDTSVQDFIRARYPSLQYLISVCNGAVALAKSGLIDGKRATSNKALWNWALQVGPNVLWQPSARWVEDGNIWSSSGISAGMDLAYRFVWVYWGPETAVSVANKLEYAPHTDADWDPFSVIHNIPGADYNRSLVDCIGPAQLPEDS